jgi:hypothetical protein
MDKVNRYRQILREVLENYAADRSGHAQPGDLETQLLFDLEHDHFQVLRVGWHGQKQVFSVVFHFDIKDGKIWAQRNVSDYDIIGDIEARGVPKEDIVLAFHAPEMRPFTEYAVA